MQRTKLSIRSLFAATLAAGGAALSGVALADDSSMSMWTGDSYAFFNNLDNSPGHFNTARAAPKAAESVATKAPAKTPDAGDRHTMMTHRTLTGTATNPFRNDTGA